MFILLLIMLNFPGVMAAKFYSFLGQREFNTWDWIYQSAKFIYIITFLNLIALLIRGWGSFTFDSISVIFSVKYVGLSVVLAIVLPWLNNKWDHRNK